MSQRTFRNSPFQGTLDVISTLSSDAMNASLRELHEQDKLTVALRQALSYGVPIEELSAESGLTCESIRARCDRELFLGEDMQSLAGR